MAFIGILGGIISFCNLLWFTRQIMRIKEGPLPSPASWLMWTLIDGVILTTTWLSDKPIWLPLSYTLGAIAVTAALLARGKWRWSYRETICAIGATAATAVWLLWGSDMGVLAGVAALTIAGTPLLLDMIREPLPETWPVYALTVTACMCTLLASDWTLTGTALAWGGIAFNGLLTMIVLRGK